MQRQQKTNVYRYVEKCLYSYPVNKARLKVLTEDLRVLRTGSDVHAQQYDKITGQGYIVFDPVASYVERIDKLESQIRYIERVTTPITQLIQELNNPKIKSNSKYSDFRIILDLYYFSGNPIDIVAQEIHCSRTTLFNKRIALVKMAVGYLGF